MKQRELWRHAVSDAANLTVFVALFGATWAADGDGIRVGVITQNSLALTPARHGPKALPTAPSSRGRWAVNFFQYTTINHPQCWTSLVLCSLNPA